MKTEELRQKVKEYGQARGGMDELAFKTGVHRATLYRLANGHTEVIYSGTKEKLEEFFNDNRTQTPD